MILFFYTTKDIKLMISFAKALETVLNFIPSPVSEAVSLDAAQNRILARDIISDTDIPQADLSTMDGFACRRQDIGSPLRVIETIAAGEAPHKRVNAGECSRIMTGALMPQGADCVVMVENTSETDGLVRVTGALPAVNVRYRAEDVRSGETVLRAGTRVTSAVVAMLASVGCDPVPVTARPLVGVIATGDELIEPACRPAAAQIRNSNGYQLCAQIRSTGCLCRYLGIVPDVPDLLQEALRCALYQCDVVILSGGVSEGDRDHVPGVMAARGVDLKFSGVAVKPGKPTVFGVVGNKYVFGLPGNPAATYIVFEMLIRPFLLRLEGSREKTLTIRARLGGTVKRTTTDRIEFVPVRLSCDGIARCVEYHGSGHIHAYGAANGIIVMPTGAAVLTEGSEIDVRLITA